MAKTKYVRKKTKAGYRCYRVGLKHKPVRMSFCKKGKKRSGGKKRRGSTIGKTCIGPAFKMRMGKAGVRCACPVRGPHGPMNKLLKMSNPKCSRGAPGPMSWQQYKARYLPKNV